eukprot:CAMPEP_0204113546 /NCGR_PEP_ID=MMETSP0361-20130328/3722_1 /ASSEMBLY_ACC=CAM_ASM_000343 /TAXON_ID=268821 /ORGANISM="Scrippsiella Hangoei, Strain SHTV-5" /LENGTH=371 /DNA_ID=CAMNT_0051063927 /DNA_START=64 /DNA_END=1179 /DNA_ORIENTATION=+
MAVHGSAYIDGQVNVGSALSVRSYTRLGSSLSVFGVVRLGSTLSVLDFAQVGSTLSVRSWLRLGSALSVFDFAHLGSSLSLRSLTRLSSSLSIFGEMRLGSSLSVSDDLFFGSRLHFGTSDTYIHYDSGSTELRFYAGGNKRMSVSSTGGDLHGTWSSESIISASDRRLKRSIEPLHLRLAAHASMAAATPAGTPAGAAAELASSWPRRMALRASAALGGGRSAAGAASQPEVASPTELRPQSARARAMDWLLRELRPVSFTFKGEGPEAKFSRYGFVAQELEKVLPDMVRTVQPRGEKHVAYQDMIAVLTLASQVQQERLIAHEKRAQVRSRKLQSQAGRLRKVQRTISKLSTRMERWEMVVGRRMAKPR